MRGLSVHLRGRQLEARLLEATRGWRGGVAPARVTPLTGWSVARFGSNSVWMLSLAVFVAARAHLWLIRRS